MITETIDGEHFLLQGLANCMVSDPETVLEAIRAEFPQTQIQLMRADRIAGREHVIFAARNAVRGFSQHRNRTHSLAVELLLYASCQPQISKAIRVLGVGPQTKEVVLAVLCQRAIPREVQTVSSKMLQGSPDDGVIETLSRKKKLELMRTYGIDREEFEATRLPNEGDFTALKRLIIERSALLSLER